MSRAPLNPVSVVQFLQRLSQRGPERACLIFGDEPQLAAEARDALICAAEKNGGRRVRLDGAELAESPPPSGGGLFGEGFLLLETSAHAKPTDAVLAAMRRAAENTRSPDMILIRLHDAEPRHEKSAWLADLGGACDVCVRAMRPNARDIADWIHRWLKNAGRDGDMSREDVAALAQHVEGNLSAAKQVVEKLLLADAGTALNLHAALRALVDGARFTVFDLADAALAGDSARALRILRALREERTADELILWALSDAGQNILTVKRGGSPKAWGSRLNAIRRAARGCGEAQARALLKLAARADRVNKGAEPGDRESVMGELTLRLAALAGGARPPV